MVTTMRRVWRLGLAGVLGACLLLAALGRGDAAAQDDGVRWHAADVGIRLGVVAGDADRLYTPASGALFASGLFSRLHRSDDGGLTWRAVPLLSPPDKRVAGDLPRVAVDFNPTNHDVAFLGGRDGLYATTDGARNWQKVAPVAGYILNVAVSRADPGLVYFAEETPEHLLNVWRSRDAGATWDRTATLSPSEPRTDCLWYAPILYPHPGDPDAVFLQASCVSGRAPGQTPLMISADQGEHWSPSYEQPEDFDGTLVGGEGADPHRFYLLGVTGAHGQSLARSDDDGHTWSVVSNQEIVTSIYALTYDPARPDRVYLGTWVSDDGGATTTRLPTDGLDGEVRDLAIGIDRRRLYAATDKGVFWLPLGETGEPTVEADETVPASRPGGAWELAAKVSETGSVSAFISASGAGLFALNSDGVLSRTDNEGTTWARVDAPTRQFGEAVAVDPSNASIMYVGGVDGVYKTENNARTWKPVLPTRDLVTGIAVSPADPSVIFISAGSGPSRLLRSRDAGLTWETIQESAGKTGADPRSCDWWTRLLLPDPSDADRLFVSAGCYDSDHAPQGPLKVSTDQGQTWTNTFDEPDSFPQRLVGGRGVAPDRFYVVAGDRLRRSDDHGATWTDVLTNGISALAYDPSRPDHLYVGLRSAGVIASQDGGATWTDLGPLGDGAIVYDLALSEDGRTLYAAAQPGVWRLHVGR
jgi:photosystem II stability/assembly factor-like uncharacterized protein